MEVELLSSLKKEDILKVLSSDGFCDHCQLLLHARIRTLRNKRRLNETSYPDQGFESSRDAEDMPVNGNASNSESSPKRLRKQWDSPRDSSQTHDSTFSNKDNGHTFDPALKYLGASKQSNFELSINDGIGGGSSVENELSEEQKEHIRYSQVQSKKDFSLNERVDGRDINVLQGLELHTQVFNPMEWSKIIECI